MVDQGRMQLIDLMLADLRRPDPTTAAFERARARSLELLGITEDDLRRAAAEVAGLPVPERRGKPGT